MGSPLDRAQRRRLAALRRQHAGLARIGEECGRRLGAHQHHVLRALQLGLRGLDDEMQPQHLDPAGAALDARRAAGALDAASRLRGDLAGELEAACAQRAAAEEQHRGLAVLQRLGRGHHRVLVGPGRRRRVRRVGDAVGLAPRRIGRQDQRRDLARRNARGLDGQRAVTGHRLRSRRRLHPVRERPGDAFDVGGERRVVLDVIERVLAHDIDDAGARFLGVVQVGSRIGEARPQVQQGRSRRVGHAVVAVGRAAAHALEQTEHAAHALDAVERADKMHFRSARIGEADLDAALQQSPNQTFRSVHGLILPPRCFPIICASRVMGFG